MSQNRVLVIDGQGGGLGKQIVEAIKKIVPQAEITAIGTNSIATAAMLKGGADQGATGENPVKVCCRNTDVIVGPIGIVLTDALLGEITAEMASAVSSSTAHKILIPNNRCNHTVVGVSTGSVSELVRQAAEKVREFLLSGSICG